MSKFSCDKGCCSYYVTHYEHPSWYGKSDDWKDPTEKMKIKKAGAFIIDKKQGKILLVQSRGQYWGPPKGSLNENEDVKDAAVREVKEETGLDLDKDSFQKFYIVKSKALYYYIELDEKNIKVQSHVKDNDANGIGWFKIDCLEELIKENKVLINLHCKLLIKRFVGLDFVIKKRNDSDSS